MDNITPSAKTAEFLLPLSKDRPAFAVDVAAAPVSAVSFGQSIRKTGPKLDRCLQ